MRSTLLFLLVTALFAASCEQEDPQSQQQPDSILDSLMVGVGHRGNFGAYSWEGGEYIKEKRLSGYQLRARALDVFCSGQDVHVAGWEYLRTEGAAVRLMGTYWINGSAARIGWDASCNGIYVDGNVTYIAGTIDRSIGGHLHKVVYWKYSPALEEVTLADNGEANAILVENGNVHVVGSAYWKNGETISLGISVRAKDIAIANGETHIVGERNSSAMYWRDGQYLEFSGASTINAIFIDGKDVYLAGQTFSGLACYWKNGERILLSYAAGSVATSIKVIDGNVYVGGRAHVACIWKNGIKQVLGGASSGEGTVCAAIDFRK